jgi:sulfite oxidase
MEHMVIGRLAEEDQERIDEQMEIIYETSEDPFANEPVRHKALRVHSEQSMSAETPSHLLTKNYLTPNFFFYIRHHHPVPFLTTEQINSYQLTIDLSAYTTTTNNGKGGKIVLTLDDLKKMPKTEVIATLQCSGNRRSGFNKYQRTSGTGWGQGAISTAKWTGVRLSDVLKYAGLDNPIDAQEKHDLKHVRFYSLDGMTASIGIEKAMNPYGDCIIAYEMNDEILPRDHGYPLRVSTVYSR